MKPEDLNPENDMEVRITALLLGELSPAEEAEVRAAMAANPDLMRLHDRLKAVMGLVRDAVPTTELPAQSIPEPLTLAHERRQELLAVFKGGSPKAKEKKIIKVSFWRRYQKDLLKLAAMVVALFGVSWLMVPKREEFAMEGEAQPRGLVALGRSIESLFSSDSDYTAAMPPPSTSAAMSTPAAPPSSEFSGLTREDVGGLRYLYSAKASSASAESAPGAVVTTTSALSLQERQSMSDGVIAYSIAPIALPENLPQVQLSSPAPSSGGRSLDRAPSAGGDTVYMRESSIVTGAAPIGGPQAQSVGGVTAGIPMEPSRGGGGEGNYRYRVQRPAASESKSLSQMANTEGGAAQGAPRNLRIILPETEVAQIKDLSDNVATRTPVGDVRFGNNAYEKSGQVAQSGGVSAGGAGLGTTHWGYQQQNEFTEGIKGVADNTPDAAKVKISGASANPVIAGNMISVTVTNGVFLGGDLAGAPNERFTALDSDQKLAEAPRAGRLFAGSGTASQNQGGVVNFTTPNIVTYDTTKDIGGVVPRGTGYATPGQTPLVIAGDNYFADTSFGAITPGMAGQGVESRKLAPGSTPVPEALFTDGHKDSLAAAEGKPQSQSGAWTIRPEADTPTAQNQPIELGLELKRGLADGGVAQRVDGERFYRQAIPLPAKPMTEPAAVSRPESRVKERAESEAAGAKVYAVETRGLVDVNRSMLSDSPTTAPKRPALLAGVDADALDRVDGLEDRMSVVDGTTATVGRMKERGDQVKGVADTRASLGDAQRNVWYDNNGVVALTTPRPDGTVPPSGGDKSVGRYAYTVVPPGQLSPLGSSVLPQSKMQVANGTAVESDTRAKVGQMGRDVDADYIDGQVGKLMKQPADRFGVEVEAARMLAEPAPVVATDLKPAEEAAKRQATETLLGETLKRAEGLMKEGKLAEAEQLQGESLKLAKRIAGTTGLPSVTKGNKEEATKLVQDAKQLHELRRLEESEAKLREVIKQDPANSAAYDQLNQIQEARYSDLARKRDFEQRVRIVDVEKAWEIPATRDSLAAANPQLKTRVFKVDPKKFAEGLESLAETTTENLPSSEGGGAQGGGGRGGGKSVDPLAVPRVAMPQGGGLGGGAGISGVTTMVLSEERQKQVHDYLKAAGVNMSSNANGASTQVFFNDRTGVLMVRASDQDMDIIQSAVEVLNIVPPQVQVEAKFADVKQSLLPKAPAVVQELAKLSEENKPALQQLVKQKEELKAEVKKVAKEEDTPAAKPVPAPPGIPQPEVSTAQNAFSTFSLNVSDVSFKLAAASLEKGLMPEAGTVRTEEFINAFNYHDPEPTGSSRVAFAWERARYPYAHDRDLVRFSVQTAAVGREPGKPLNIVLLLDNSGSMERADRIRIRQECLRVLGSQLQPQDKVSVVAFARTARLWVDGLAGAQANELPGRVGNLTPEGGTNLEEAMNLAYQTAQRHFVPNGVNRVVLLTDGAANLGDVKPESLKKKVVSFRQQGVALDCFGIGWEGYNDDLLEALSRNGDGRYGFVNSPEAATTEFASQLAGALKVAASDVKVQVEWNPKRVTVFRQLGYAKHQLKKEEFRDNTVDAAEIGAAEAGNALYTVQVNPAGEGPLGVVRVRYRLPGTNDYREQEWPLVYDGASKSMEQASLPLRLAGTASAFSEWLVTSPYAAEVTPEKLIAQMAGVPEAYPADPRPKQLEWMIRQAKSLSGK
ncbi:MAG: von Willebrand factor [Verrucomicrobia bacterium]|nr:von Willebrand factor [Verrucomicrobiota bacterium]